MRFGLAFVLATVLAFSGFAQQQNEWFQGKPIKNIVFEGLVHISASELDGIIEPFIGAPFSDSAYWELLGRLYALEYFDNLSPTAIPVDSAASGVVIRFTVTERPTIARITFSGNSNIRRTELLNLITLSTNDVATQLRLRMDETAIVNRYLERGFPDIKVRAETETISPSRVVLTFHIEEGEKIAIERILFEGNTVFTSRVLQRQLSLRTRRLFVDGAFSEAALIADRQAIQQHYHDRGFIDAAVIDDVREIRKDDRGNNLMTITFRIHEGRMYTFGGVTFSGNSIFTTEQLSAQVRSRVGAPVNSRQLQSDLMRVSAMYFEGGYIFNRIEPIQTQNSETGVLTVNVDIVERGRAHIENIIIRGNTKTRDSVILRELPLVPGDVFSQAKIIEGMRNLFNLQFFSAINPETPPGSVDALMDLVINVEEQMTTDVQFGLTFSGSSDPSTLPISAMVRWTDRNFMGTGNTVGADATYSSDSQVLSMQYTQRWALGLPLSANFDFTIQRNQRRAPMANFDYLFNGDESFAFPAGFDSFDQYLEARRTPPSEYLMTYSQWRLSLGVGTGYRWTTAAGILGVGVGFRVGMVLNSYDQEIFTPFDPLLRNRNNLWTPATSVWTSVSLDRRDVFFDPTSGYYLLQRLGWFGIMPIEQEHYIRTDSRAQWFYTLLNLPVTENWNFRVVFGINSALSFIFPQPQHSQPFIEEANQLSVDGMFVGRGWISEFRRRGLALWDNWAELRIPLAPGILALDFFFDAAGIAPTPSDMFSSNYWHNDGSAPDHNTFFLRFSVGGGLRFTIPQFPIRLSFARRALIQDGSWQWQQGALFGNTLDFVVSFAISGF
ncbi:MAG: outer membrane protein assembly factor BamA [Treponema sp.]|nr:outer membrane protein assembly factor BamA [Treponema sp.]